MRLHWEGLGVSRVGAARAAKPTPKKRSAIAAKGAKARWGKKIIAFAMVFMLSACGPTGGKKLATESAIKSLEKVSKYGELVSLAGSNLDGPLIHDMELASEAIAIARQAGDPSRKADVQLNIRLAECQRVILSFSQPPFNDADRKEHHMMSSKDTIQSLCIDPLKRDLGN
jgi:hypothetical protein